MPTLTDIYNLPLMASGEKTKARDILAAIHTLARIEQAQRPVAPDEQRILGRFSGFGAVALSLFPNPITGRYKDESWQALGEELRAILSPEEYDSAKRTTFTAFYTSPTVITAMHEALARLGVPENATVLEPGCGTGHFISQSPAAMRFIGVELDRLSGRIARVLHPGQDIRVENFRDTRLSEGRIDAVIGNVPFADIHLEYRGQRLALHDFFLAKSLDALKPGGVLALVTSHYTLDKQSAGLRERIAATADFLGAIRLPADAFRVEGTKVVTDILFLHKRPPDAAPNHADPDWLETAPLRIEGVDIAINRYFHHRPAMVLGTWTRQDRLYGSETGYSLTTTGNLATQLRAAIQHLPQGVFSGTVDMGRAPPPTATFTPPPLPHIAEGSFFVGDDRTILQVLNGEAVPVTHITGCEFCNFS
jgi:SAM-dependent methyltransferase